MLAQILGARFRDEREEREVHPALGIRLLGFGAQLGHTREVDFEETGDVCRDAPRHHHVIGGDLADLGPGLDAVARPRLDGGMLDGATGGRGARCAVRGGGRWSLLDVSKDILLRHATGVTATRDPRDVHTVLGRDFADEGRRFRAQTLLGRLDSAVPISALQRGSRRRGWGGRGRTGCLGSRCRHRLGRLGFRWRRSRSGSRSRSRFRCGRAGVRFQNRDERLHGHRLPFLHLDLREDAGRWCRDLGVDFVGRDLEQRLIPLHMIAGLLAPLRQRPLYNALAHLGHHDVSHK